MGHLVGAVGHQGLVVLEITCRSSQLYLNDWHLLTCTPWLHIHTTVSRRKHTEQAVECVLGLDYMHVRRCVQAMGWPVLFCQGNGAKLHRRLTAHGSVGYVRMTWVLKDETVSTRLSWLFALHKCHQRTFKCGYGLHVC